MCAIDHKLTGVKSMGYICYVMVLICLILCNETIVVASVVNKTQYFGIPNIFEFF